MKKTKNKLPRSILLTGAAGFIGSNTLKYLFDKYPDYHFTVLDALTYSGDIKNIPDYIHKSRNFKFIYGDVRNQKMVDDLVREVDTVVHFAAETHIPRSINSDSIFFETDVLGTHRIASAVVNNREKIKRLIHISTSEVYGTAMEKKMDENHSLNPQSPYAAAKLGADRLVYSYMITHKIPAVIVRPFNMYGPNQHLEKLIPRFITSLILEEPMTVHGTGESSRDFTHVDDLVAALDLIIHAKSGEVDGEVFNVGSGRDYSVNDIARLVVKLMRSNGMIDKITHTSYALNIGDRPGQVFRHNADTSKLRKKLGWKPKVDFESGLKKTIDWYVNNKEWWSSKIWMRHVPIETENKKVEMH